MDEVQMVKTPTYYETHKDSRKEFQKRYYETHKEKIRTNYSTESHKAKRAEYMRAYRASKKIRDTKDS